jgi:hypothetical protein
MWFCAQTPNKMGYVSIAARIIPERLQSRVLAAVWPERQTDDVFPTVYKLNTLRSIRKYFRDADWENLSYIGKPTPKYHGNNRLLFTAIGLYQALVPTALGTNLLVFLRKR